MENNIRRFRRELEKSQDWLAEATGLSRQSIVYYERGTPRSRNEKPRAPGCEVKAKIAAALGRTIAEVWPVPKEVQKGAVVLIDV